MDGSKKNIRMCEMAEEIRKLWCAKKGDNFAYKEQDLEYHVHTVRNTAGYFSKYPVYVWLPTQSDLQEMVDWRTCSIRIEWCSLPYKFSWQDDPLRIDGVNGDSMEQMWLAFVMKANYRKVWDNKKEDWIKTD